MVEWLLTLENRRNSIEHFLQCHSVHSGSHMVIRVWIWGTTERSSCLPAIHIDWYIYLTSTYYMKKLTSAHSNYNIKHVTHLLAELLLSHAVLLLAGQTNKHLSWAVGKKNTINRGFLRCLSPKFYIQLPLLYNWKIYFPLFPEI
jgi:hypothetical protein